MRRAGQVLVFVAAVLAVGAGCVQVPQPVSPTEPPRPALTVAQAGPVLQHVHDVVDRADRRQDAGLADDVLTGYELEVARGTWTMSRQTKTALHYTAETVTVLSVYSGPASAYPQQAVAVGRYSEPDLARWTSLRYLVRTDAGSPWKLALTTWLPTRQLPTLHGRSDTVTSFPAAGTRLAGVSLGAVSATLANALNDPTGSTGRRFTSNPFKAADLASDARGHHDHGTNTFNFYARTDGVALRTADGGALVLTTNRYVARTVGDRGWFLYYTDSYKKAFPHHYDSSIETGLTSSPVLVSPKGRLTLLALDISPDGYAATESTE